MNHVSILYFLCLSHGSVVIGFGSLSPLPQVRHRESERRQSAMRRRNMGSSSLQVDGWQWHVHEILNVDLLWFQMALAPQYVLDRWGSNLWSLLSIHYNVTYGDGSFNLEPDQSTM